MPTEEELTGLNSHLAQRVVAFDGYEFEAGTRRLSYAGKVVPLEPKVAAFITLLVCNSGKLLPRDWLRCALWPDDAASEDRLNYVASRARHALRHCRPGALSTTRRRGYRLALQPTTTTSLEETELVERHAELHQIRRLLEQCVSSRTSRTVIVTGAVGTGKTALLERFAETTPKVLARCILRRCRGQLAPVWRSLLNEVHENQVAGAGDSSASASTFCESLERLCLATPLVLVVDDLDLADSETIALLASTSARSSGPVLIVASSAFPGSGVRSSNLPGGPLEELTRHAVSMALGPLSRRGARRLLQASRVTSMTGQLESQLLELSGGNPLLLCELCRATAAYEHELADEQIDQFFTAPSRIHDVLRRQFSALPAPVRRLLVQGATIGDEFDVEVLAAMDDRPVAEVVELLSRGVCFEVLRRCSPSQFAFAHSSYRRFFKQSTSELERRELHWRIGMALRALHYDESSSGVEQIALHLAEGVMAEAQAAEAVRWVRAAAELNLQQGLLTRAIERCLLALRLAKASNFSVGERVTLMLDLADSLRHGDATNESVRFCEQAMDLARRHGDMSGFGRAVDSLRRATRDSTKVERQRL